MSATNGQPGPVEKRWGTRPTEQRQAELEKMRREWEAEGDPGNRRGPFDNVTLDGADVFWLAVQAASDHYSKAKAEQLLVQESIASPDLSRLHLEGATLRETHLEKATTLKAHGVRLEKAALRGAHLEGADLWGAHLEGAYLWEAHLEGANLLEAHLEGARLIEAHLEGAKLWGTHLEGANFIEASFDRTSRLNSAHLNHVSLDQVTFDNTNLTVVTWKEVRKLGDELRANRRHEYSAAARAYRALSVTLRNQGITDAARFHYRSEVMERKALFRETGHRLFSRSFYLAPLSFARWLVSWVLGTFMGYGDYISRLFLTYAGVVVAFAAVYLGLTYQPAAGHPLAVLPWPRAFAAVSWVRDLVSFWLVRVPAAYSVASTKYKFDALVFSVTAFHGRGLQVQPWSQQDAVIWWAGVEAVLGLLIEALFVAAFARRVTGG